MHWFWLWASEAVKVTGVSPKPKVAGASLPMLGAGLQVSVATAMKGTTSLADAPLELVHSTVVARQVITGGLGPGAFTLPALGARRLLLGSFAAGRSEEFSAAFGSPVPVTAIALA